MSLHVAGDPLAETPLGKLRYAHRCLVVSCRLIAQYAEHARQAGASDAEIALALDLPGEDELGKELADELDAIHRWVQ